MPYRQKKLNKLLLHFKPLYLIAPKYSFTYGDREAGGQKAWKKVYNLGACLNYKLSQSEQFRSTYYHYILSQQKT